MGHHKCVNMCNEKKYERKKQNEYWKVMSENIPQPLKNKPTNSHSSMTSSWVHSKICVYIYLYIYIYKIKLFYILYMYIYIYTYTYICIYMCVYILYIYIIKLLKTPNRDWSSVVTGERWPQAQLNAIHSRFLTRSHEDWKAIYF